MRGWVYRNRFGTWRDGWMALLADGDPGDANIIDDLGDFTTHAEAIDAVCSALRVRT